MALVLPTAAELGQELEDTGSSGMRAKCKDTCWSVKLKDDDNMEPADVHGAA